MFKKIKIVLIVLVLFSISILAILFLQDRTKKLEDRVYKNINNIVINSDNANINVYKSKDENTRVIIYGTNKDFAELVEGTNYLSISKVTGDNKCILNCKNEIDLYVPDGLENINIITKKGNVEFDKVSMKEITIYSDIGNISIFKANVININSNKGNITIKEINATNNSNIVSDIGNVMIDKVINLKLNTKSKTGSVVIPLIRDEQEFTLKIETNVGNIDISHYENKSE